MGRPGQGMASTRRAALGKAVASRDLSGVVFSKWSRSFHAQSFGYGSGMTKAVKAGRSSLVNRTGKQPPAPEASRTGTARHGGRSLVCGSRHGDAKWMQGQGRKFSVYRKREKLTVVLVSLWRGEIKACAFRASGAYRVFLSLSSPFWVYLFISVFVTACIGFKGRYRRRWVPPEPLLSSRTTF